MRSKQNKWYCSHVLRAIDVRDKCSSILSVVAIQLHSWVPWSLKEPVAGRHESLLNMLMGAIDRP